MLEFNASAHPGSLRTTRRTWLQLGGLAPLGLSLPTLLAGSAQASPKATAGGFGSAKRCLLIFMWGGPAHQDLWDLKPNAPAGIRGEFRPISTKVPGFQICEHLPKLAAHTDKMALIRSVTHTDNNHSTSAHWMLTGSKHRLTAENFGASSIDHPHMGSVLTKLLPSASGMPTFVSLPERIGTTAGFITPGQTAGLLGNRYDPFFIESDPNDPNFKVDALVERVGIDPERVGSRRALQNAFNQAQTGLEAARPVQAMNAYYQRAAELVTSANARAAFNLSAESDKLREQYGRGTFGQSLLLARRLLEAGVRLVTVYWHRDKSRAAEDTTWDTHGNNFNQLKNRLIPQVDQPLAQLFTDLSERGLLDDTLVVWSSEFGRTPRVNGGAGRDHWGACNSVWLAGAGVPGGQIYGKSDAQAAFPADNPVSPSDLSATMFHLLGVHPHDTFRDREDRPHSVSHGQVISPVLDGLAPANDTLPTQPTAPAFLAINPEIMADHPLAYWPLQTNPGSAEFKPTAGGPLPPPASTTVAPANPIATRYLGNPAAGDERFEAIVRDWPNDRYAIEFWFRNDRPVDQELVTGYLVSRGGEDPNRQQVDFGEHLGIGGTHNSGVGQRGRLFVFNGDDRPEGSLVGKQSLDVGRWYHVVMQRNQESVQVFLNGQTAQPEISGKLACHVTLPQFFGATRSDNMFPLHGQIRHVALYAEPLPLPRIEAHFQAAIDKSAKAPA